MIDVVDMQYENLLWDIRNRGVAKDDRTGVGTTSLFGCRLRYDLAAGFPLITTKDVNFRAVAAELLWFLAGDTNVAWLREQGVRIWDEWADPDGNLGPIYGEQWRNWGGHVDQVANVLDQLRTDPNSRRMIVSAWNIDDLPRMALPPCHLLWQLYVAGGRLSCQVYQRSADMFLGVPFNIASYGLLTHLLAQQAGLTPGDLIWVGGDCHIYHTHITQVIEQGRRYPYPFPRLEVEPAPTLNGYTLDHFTLHDYRHHPALRGPVAV